jgi:hypothetical protein
VAAALGAVAFASPGTLPEPWNDDREEAQGDERPPEPQAAPGPEPRAEPETLPAPEPAESAGPVEPEETTDESPDADTPVIAVGSVPEMPEVPSIDPDAESAADTVPTSSVRQQDVCETLFAEGRGLSDARDVFASDYADMFVHWSGELKSARHYYSDMQFGNEPGTRVEVSIARVASGILGEREIVAVVQLPDGAEKELADRIGETVTFEGDLASMDPFMRQVFVRNAAVID